MSPHDFCRKVGLCEDIAPPPPARPTSLPAASTPRVTLSGERLCDFCHRAISKVLNKLKDPGTEVIAVQICPRRRCFELNLFDSFFIWTKQLTIVESLVKGCIVADRFAQKVRSS